MQAHSLGNRDRKGESRRFRRSAHCRKQGCGRQRQQWQQRDRRELGWAGRGSGAIARRPALPQPPDRRYGCGKAAGNAALDTAGEGDRGITVRRWQTVHLVSVQGGAACSRRRLARCAKRGGSRQQRPQRRRRQRTGAGKAGKAGRVRSSRSFIVKLISSQDKHGWTSPLHLLMLIQTEAIRLSGTAAGALFFRRPVFRQSGS